MMGDTHPNEISLFQLVHMILLRFVGFTYNSTLINFKSNPKNDEYISKLIFVQLGRVVLMALILFAGYLKNAEVSVDALSIWSLSLSLSLSLNP